MARIAVVTALCCPQLTSPATSTQGRPTPHATARPLLLSSPEGSFSAPLTPRSCQEQWS